jgi:hypothetical protein
MTSSRSFRAVILSVAVLALAGANAGVQPGQADAATPPGSLLAFFGYPSKINGATTVAEAANEFGRYDFVILPGTTKNPQTGVVRVGVEDPSHPDHAATVAIIAHPAMAGTFVIGYVNLGVSNGGFTMEQLKQRVDQWRAMGVDAIQFDAMGYDWEVTRERQNAAVDYVHSLGMPVVANAWRPEHAFGTAIDTLYNPTGAPSHLGAGDFYMYESYWVRLGREPNPSDPDFWTYEYWLDKTQLVAAYQATLGFSILSVTTNTPADVFSQQLFNAAWQKAAEYGHRATGWGQYLFAADDNLAPYRPRPAASGEVQAVCGGLPATIIGTPGADRLSGTEHPDVIAGLDGPDVISGLGGDDVICGGAGQDTIYGGAGKDRLLGGAGGDSLFGDAANDRLLGQGGDDILQGGLGNNDVARGGPLTDICVAEQVFACEG